MSEVSEPIFTCVRVRPEGSPNAEKAWRVENGDLLFLGPPDTKIPMDLSFDRVFGDSDGGNEVYDGVLDPLLRIFIEGFHGFLFFYGNAKGGKTYSTDQVLNRAALQLFSTLRARKDREYAVRFSCGELQSEQARDLLDPTGFGDVQVAVTSDGSELEGIVEASVTTSGELNEQIKAARARREEFPKELEDKRSHAHYFYRITLESRQSHAGADVILGDFEPILRSHLTLVDMGASCRGHGNFNFISRLREGLETQRGMLAFERIVDALSDASDDPSRAADAAALAASSASSSALTRLVAPALGGNALAGCVLCVDGAWDECDATMDVLRFGVKLRRVASHAVQNSTLRRAGGLGSALIAEEEAAPRIGGRPLTKDESDTLVARLATGALPPEDGSTDVSVVVSRPNGPPSERSLAVAAPQAGPGTGANWSPHGSGRGSVLSAILGNFGAGEVVAPAIASDPAALMEHHLRLERERHRGRGSPHGSATASLRAAVAGVGPAQISGPTAVSGAAGSGSGNGGLLVRLGGGFPFIHFREDSAPVLAVSEQEQRRHRSSGRRDRDHDRDRERSRDRRDRDRDRKDRDSRRRDSSQHHRDRERRSSRSRRRDDDLSDGSYGSDYERKQSPRKRDRRDAERDRNRDRNQEYAKESRRGSGGGGDQNRQPPKGAGALGANVLQASGAYPRTSSVHSGSSGKSNTAVNGKAAAKDSSPRRITANGRTISKTSSVSFGDSSAKGTGTSAVPPSASAADLVKSYFTADMKTADLTAKVDGLKTAPLRDPVQESPRNGPTLFNLEKKPVLDEPLWRLARSRFRSSWSREQVQLLGHPRPHSLVVFKSKRNLFMQKVKDPQGSVIFLGETLVVTKEDVAGKYAFNIKLGTKQYTWAADTADRRDEWMRHLVRASKKADEAANGATGTPRSAAHSHTKK